MTNTGNKEIKVSVIFFQIPSLKKLYRDLNFNFKETFNAYLETKGIWKIYLIFLYVCNSVSKTKEIDTILFFYCWVLFVIPVLSIKLRYLYACIPILVYHFMFV